MKVAVITGASSGLGVEFLEAVVERYPDLDEIWILARRKDRLEQLKAKYPTQAIVPIVADLANEATYGQIREYLLDKKPDIRVLINNAGCAIAGEFAEMSEEAILAMIHVNIKALTMIQRLCMPYMHRGSFTVMTCSVTAFVPIPLQAVYSASKSYVYSLGKALREEVRQQGVHLLLLCPGNMNTEMNPQSPGELRQPQDSSGQQDSSSRHEQSSPGEPSRSHDSSSLHEPSRSQGLEGRRMSRLPFLDMKKITRRALKKAERGKSVYTMGLLYQIFHLCSCLFPSLMIKISAKFMEELSL